MVFFVLDSSQDADLVPIHSLAMTSKLFARFPIHDALAAFRAVAGSILSASFLRSASRLLRASESATSG